MVSPQHEGIRKRSIRKAISIASRTGLSLYRGKILAANVAFKPSPPRTEKASSGHRMRIFSWNCSGLSQELLAELLLWLDYNPQISVIFLQETHWGQTMEWSKKDWHFIHSASGQPNSAGLLVGVRDSLAKVDGISCALDTWSRKLATYEHPKGRSQIDFVLVRQHSADRVAKQTKPEKTILAGWRTSGHLPLQANLILSWKPWKRSRKPNSLPAQKVPKLLGFLGEQGIHGLYDDFMLQEQHSMRPRMPQLESSNRQVLSLWELKKRLRLCSPCILGGFFRAFRQVVVYCRAQRELRKSIRRSKRRQLLETLQLAEEAAVSASSSNLFGYASQDHATENSATGCCWISG